MIAHHFVFFFTPEYNFDKIKTMLKEEFGLVPPLDANEERLKRQLVWEDSTGLGRYRVNLTLYHKATRSDSKGVWTRAPEFDSPPSIHFRYWSQRLNEETIKNDPMRPAYLRAYELLKPVKVTDCLVQEINLEKLLQP